MTEQHPITPPPPHLLKKFSTQAQAEAKKRNGAGYHKTFATLCIEWAMNSQSTSNDCQIRSSEIQPPPELVQQWWKSAPENGDWLRSLATKAARWGSDHELLACGNYLEKCAAWEPEDVNEFYNYRRPEPPSLKEQALAVITNSAICDHLSPQHEAILRRALEALDD